MDDRKLQMIIYGIRKRCFDTKCKIYKHYGGRGITVCDRWLGKDGVKHFIEDMKPTYRPGLTIERIDVDGNYEPSNCSWATMKEQANNRTSSRYITYNGETKTMAMWADTIGIKYKTLAERLNGHGWSIEKALSTPTRMRRV